MALLADAILRVASKFRLPVIDWRRVMTEVEDFANPIEPSSIGGAKMAEAIVYTIRNHPFEMQTTVVYPQDYPGSQLIQAAMPSQEELALQGLPQRLLTDKGAPAEETIATSVLDHPESAAVAAGLRGRGAEAPSSN